MAELGSVATGYGHLHAGHNAADPRCAQRQLRNHQNPSGSRRQLPNTPRRQVRQSHFCTAFSTASLSELPYVHPSSFNPNSIDQLMLIYLR